MGELGYHPLVQPFLEGVSLSKANHALRNSDLFPDRATKSAVKKQLPKQGEGTLPDYRCHMSSNFPLATWCMFRMPESCTADSLGSGHAGTWHMGIF